MPPKPKIDYTALAANYGFAYSVLTSNKQLHALFNQAVANTWSPDVFAAHLRNTEWFKTTSADARQWIVLNASDPATAKARIAQRVATISAEAKQLGITLTSAQLQSVSQHSLMFGWDDQQIKNSISSDWQYGPHTSLAGQAGAAVSALRKTAADYLVPLSDTTVNNWVHQVLQGTATSQDFTVWAQQQAKSLFPTWGHQIDQGLTVKDLTDPYAQMAGQALGVDPQTIDFTQPKWRGLIDHVDPKSGQRLPLSLADAQTKIRNDPAYGYDGSQEAAQNASKFATTLAQAFGAQ